MEITDQPTSIICLSRKRIEYGRCRHLCILVDPDLEYVKCRDCGEKLNPMNVLYRMCREESQWKVRCEEYHQWYEKYKKRVRVKCEHCNRMTPVHVG